MTTKRFGNHLYELSGEYTVKKDAASLVKAWRGTRQYYARIEKVESSMGKGTLYLVWKYRKPKRGMEW